MARCGGKETERGVAKPEACPSCVPHTVLSSPHFPPLEPQRGLRLFPLGNAGAAFGGGLSKLWRRPPGLPAGCWSPRGRREGALRGAGRGTGPKPGVAGRQPHCPLRPAACCSAFLSRGGPQGLVPTSCPHQMQMLSQLWALGASHSPVSREVMGNPCQMPRDGVGQ